MTSVPSRELRSFGVVHAGLMSFAVEDVLMIESIVRADVWMGVKKTRVVDGESNQRKK